MKLKRSIEAIFRRAFTHSPWSGNYPDWASAARKATGYDSNEILKKVEAAALQVKKGEAVYERDSVLFDNIEYSWPLLSALLFTANQNNSSLKVLDFGGSLGSSYFQNRAFMSGIRSIEWNVVEQSSFVTTGREKMQDETLRFFYSIEEYIQQNGLPHILLLSCVLPYIEQPYDLLRQLLAYKIPYIIIDNTYFNDRNGNRICLQKVHELIYPASYPCWFLDYPSVKEIVNKEYEIISEHKNEEIIYLDGRPINYKGFFAGLRGTK